MRKPIIVIFILLLVIISLSILQVVVSNRISTAGIILGKLQKDMQVFKRENALLSEKLLFASSLTQIASTAATLGFIEGKLHIVLTSHLPLAVKSR